MGKTSEAEARTRAAVEVLRKWQGIERDAIETTAEIMEKTDNLLIRQVMEIQFLIDAMTRNPIRLSPEELAEVWGEIEAHDELERETIGLAEQLRDEVKDPVVKILLNYLLVDEQKHDTLLGELTEFKKHMSKLA